MGDTEKQTPRFRVDHRCGIIAVLDTHHESYGHRGPGCHGDEPWCVAFWTGFPVKNEQSGLTQYWDIEPWKIERAHNTCDILNNFQPIPKEFCCDDLAKAFTEGTDHEQCEALLSINPKSGATEVGSGLPDLRFCPWCGKALKNNAEEDLWDFLPTMKNNAEDS